MSVKFTADQFTAISSTTTAEDKAKFANKLVRFIESDFDRAKFKNPLYTSLSFLWGHIANYNIDGFYGTWCRRTFDKLAFLQRIAERPTYGDPSACWVDVEQAIRDWVREQGLVEKYKTLHEQEVEQRERAELARLQAKYGETA